MEMTYREPQTPLFPPPYVNLVNAKEHWKIGELEHNSDCDVTVGITNSYAPNICIYQPMFYASRQPNHQKFKSNQITFIVTSPQHKCLGEWNSWERAPNSAKKQNNLHIDSTYLQTVQKTMCIIHIHILNIHSVL